MQKILVARYRHDGSGGKTNFKVRADCWIKSYLDGSNGRQPLWYFLAAKKGVVTAKATIYEDRNPHRKLKDKKRLYRWDVFPAGDQNCSFARGECVSLSGAKEIAETCAYHAAFVKPFVEKEHR